MTTSSASTLSPAEVPVPLTAHDLQFNRDRALEEAQAKLATMKPWDK